MGIDLTAIVNQQVDAETAFRLPRKLNEDAILSDLGMRLCVFAYGEKRAKELTYDWEWCEHTGPKEPNAIDKTWHDGECEVMYGPTCALWLSKNVCHIKSFFRLYSLPREEQLQNLLRGFFAPNS